MQKKSDMASGGGNDALHTEFETTNCKTAKLFNSTTWKCEVCKGFGHEYWECPTKKRLDAFAKNNGEKAIWGSWKFYRYYRDISPEKRKVHKELAASAAGRKRTFKTAFGSSASS